MGEPKEEDIQGKFDLLKEIQSADEVMPVNENQKISFSSWFNSLGIEFRDEISEDREKFLIAKESFRQGIRLQRPPSGRPFSIFVGVLKKQLNNTQQIKDRLLSGDTKGLEVVGKDKDTFYNRLTRQILNLVAAEEQIRILDRKIELVQKYSRKFDPPIIS